MRKQLNNKSNLLLVKKKMMDNLIANKPKKLQLDGQNVYLNSKEIIVPSIDKYDDEGDDHIFTGIETPLRKDALLKAVIKKLWK